MEKVEYYFREISKIPRGSYNEKAICDYVENFAKEKRKVHIENVETIIVKVASLAARKAFGKENAIGQTKKSKTQWSETIETAKLAVSCGKA